MCFGDFLPMRTLCDAYHKEFESHWRSILDISVLTVLSQFVWENLDRGLVYRSHSIRSVLRTLVKILSCRPLTTLF